MQQLSTGYPQVIHRVGQKIKAAKNLSLKIFTAIFSFSILSLSLLTTVATFALPAQFDQNLIFEEEDVYSLPAKFNSAEKIRNYLRKQGSFLADYRVRVDFEKDDDILMATFGGAAKNLQPKFVIEEDLGKNILVSDLIWKLARTDLANGCSMVNYKVCFNNSQKPLNPGFILALIQKESGLIYGTNAKLKPESEDAQFLLDRVVGYYCTDAEDKSKSCFDQNPDWKYFKGFFRQLYYSVRFVRIMERRCEMGGSTAMTVYGQKFVTGEVVNIEDEEITLKNALTCAMYIYTPHVSAQKLIYGVMKEMQ